MLGAVRERLAGSFLLTPSRLQATVEEAVQRGRITRDDAEDLVARLISIGRSQSEEVLSEIEGAINDGVRAAGKVVGAADAPDRVLRQVDRVRRAARIGNFPILGYDDLAAGQVTSRLGDLSAPQLRKVRDYERRHGNRKSVLEAVERHLRR